ncbi:MAG: Hsp33 family molecular chaperone HslO [Candidatus Kapaibacterium sp.]|jgi:molecular chaperone Hsp33|nr:Hsp33 family molecular chaperone HslO [Candidatus Kapabacteria bacterium]
MNKDEIKRNIRLRDRAVRVLSKNGAFRAVCVKNTLAAQTAQKNHELNSISAALLARALAAASLSAALLKGEERIAIDIDGDGQISKVFAEAMQIGEVRGFIEYRNDIKEINFTGIEDLIGNGNLKVSRILYNKPEPIQGIVPLQKGDIATDLSYYYMQSEQIPSALVLDCSINNEGIIEQSGGILIQAMPGYNDLELLEVHDSLRNMKALSEYLKDDLNPLECLKEILPFEFNVLNSTQIDFFCRCSKDNFTSKLITLGKQEIEAMKIDGHNELVCRYCNKHYTLLDEDFDKLIYDLTAISN